MKAEEWLRENVELNDWNKLEECLPDSLWTNNVIRYMEKYAANKDADVKDINELLNAIAKEHHYEDWASMRLSPIEDDVIVELMIRYARWV